MFFEIQKLNEFFEQKKKLVLRSSCMIRVFFRKKNVFTSEINQLNVWSLTSTDTSFDNQ